MKKIFIFLLLLSLTLIVMSCQQTVVGEATKLLIAEDISDVRFRPQLTPSEAREFQEKESSLRESRVYYVEKKGRSLRGKERKEEGEEELPISISFPTVLFDIAHIDLTAALTKEKWEKISVPGFGSYWSVSAFTDAVIYSDSNKGVVKMLTVAYGALYEWDLNKPLWKQVGVGQFTYPDYFFDAQIDPTNKNHFIVAVRDLEKGKLVIKIYSTYDDGKTWTSSLSLPNVDSYDAVSIYFMDGKHVILEHATAGVYASSDSGKTWKNTKKGIIGRHARFFPGFNSKGKVMLYFPDEKKIYYSTDWGETWASVFDTAQFSKNGEISYAIGNSNTKYVIASAKEAVSKTVYRQEEGKEWKSSQVQFPSNGNTQSFVVDPKNDNHLIIFQYMFGPAESWDGGQTWFRHYAEGSGLKVDLAPELCPPDVENCQSLAYDVRSTFVDQFFHLYHATDQGLFMIIPSSAKGSNDMFQNNIAQSLSFTESFDVKVDWCGNLYYGVWHRSPVIQTKEGGIYFIKSPEKAGLILSDPTQCLKSPAIIYGYYGETGAYSYLQDLVTNNLPAAINYKDQIQGAILYFKDQLYYIDAKTGILKRSDKYHSNSPEILLNDITYIFKSKSGPFLYAVDSSGALWQTSDGDLWNEFIFPISSAAKDDFKLRSGAATASNFVLAFSDRFFGSVDSGKTIQSWPNYGQITQIQSDASCQTRLFAVSDTVDKQGVTSHTIKVSYDFGQTWQEFGEGISGVHELYLGDSDSKSVYVSTIGKGVWKRSTENLVCKKWSEIEKKFSSIKETCDNGFDDDGNGLTDCADLSCVNSVTYNYLEEIMCMDTVSQVCSSENRGMIISVNDDFDALCLPDLFSNSWVECNADGSLPEKQSMKGVLFAGIGVSKKDAHYLCAPFKSSLGKNQKGYHGFESWYVCGVEKKGDYGVASKVGDIVGNFVCTSSGWANPTVLKQFCDATEKPNTKVGSKKEDSVCAQRADSVGVMIKDKLVWDETCVGVYRGIPVVELVSASGKQLLFGMVKEGSSLVSSIGWEDKLCGAYINSVKKKGWGSSGSFVYPLTFDEAKKCIDSLDQGGKEYLKKIYLDGCS